MLLLLQQAMLTAPPTVTDSLRRSIAQLQHKVDSLEKVVLKTEIGTGFFSEIIALQLGVFLFLVGIAGWIGWRSLTDKFNKIRTETMASVTISLSNHQTALNTSVNEIKDKLNHTHYDVCRSMYNFTIVNKQSHLTFGWAIRTAVALHNWKKDDLPALHAMLKNAELSTKGIPYKEPYTLSKLGVLNEYFKVLLDIKDPETSVIVNDIIIKFNEALFTLKT